MIIFSTEGYNLLVNFVSLFYCWITVLSSFYFKNWEALTGSKQEQWVSHFYEDIISFEEVSRTNKQLKAWRMCTESAVTRLTPLFSGLTDLEVFLQRKLKKFLVRINWKKTRKCKLACWETDTGFCMHSNGEASPTERLRHPFLHHSSGKYHNLVLNHYLKAQSHQPHRHQVSNYSMNFIHFNLSSKYIS